MSSERYEVEFEGDEDHERYRLRDRQAGQEELGVVVRRPDGTWRAWRFGEHVDLQRDFAVFEVAIAWAGTGTERIDWEPDDTAPW